MSAASVVGLLRERAAAAPSQTVLRTFRYGCWESISYAALAARARSIGGGLVARGVSAGDVVAVICEDGATAVAVELAVQGAGACALVLDPNLSPATTRARMRAAGAVAAVVGDQEQYDKVADPADPLTSLRLVAVEATRGIHALDDTTGGASAPASTERLVALRDLESGGSAGAAGWDAAAARATAADAARVEVAAGSLVRRTHGDVLRAAEQVRTTLALGAADRLVAVHETADPLEHALLVAGPLLSGAVSHYAGRAGAQQALRAVQPTVLHATARWATGVDAEVAAHTERAGGLKGRALASGLRRRTPAGAVRTTPYRNPIRATGVALAAAVGVFWLLTVHMNDVARLVLTVLGVGAVLLGLVLSGNAVAGPLRRRYGLARCRAVVSSGALPGAELFGALDVPVVDLSAAVATAPNASNASSASQERT